MFQSIRPTEILYELDGEPILFSSVSRTRSVICYKIDSALRQSQYIVSPTSDRILQDVRNGRMSLRAAVVQAWTWIVEAGDENFNVTQFWNVSSDLIPDDLLPKEGIALPYLHMTESPYLSIKFCGGAIKNGTLPLVVIKTAVEEVYTSLLRIFATAAHRAAFGVTETRMRRAITIPTHEFSHASLTIAIEKPEIDISEIGSELIINLDLANKNMENAHENFLRSAEVIADAVDHHQDIGNIASDHLETLEILTRIIPGNNSFFNAVEINGRRSDKIARPSVIEGKHGQMLRELYDLASGSLQQLKGEVFLINGHSHQFTMTVGDRDVTCVATTEAQQDQVDLLSKGDLVFVRGHLRKRQQRDLLKIQALRVGDGLTIT